MLVVFLALYKSRSNRVTMAMIISNNNQDKRKSPQISFVRCVHTNNCATILRHHFLLKRSLEHEQHWNSAIWAISLTVKPLVLCRKQCEVQSCGSIKSRKCSVAWMYVEALLAPTADLDKPLHLVQYTWNKQYGHGDLTSMPLETAS